MQLLAEHAAETPYFPIQQVTFTNPLGLNDNALVLVLDNGYLNPADTSIDYFTNLWNQIHRKDS